MARIPQEYLFGWKEIDLLGDLERLRLVLGSLPDEELMKKLEEERDRGRDDYPVRATWNSLMAKIVFQHPSVESLRRELLRNGQLRQVCGFDPMEGEWAVPSSSAYTRFNQALMRHQEEVDQILNKLVDALKDALPNFGQALGIDSKAIPSLARRKPKAESDGRRDLDADVGVKTYWSEDSGGKPVKRIKTWFGFKVHLVVETNYEIPVAMVMTKASVADAPMAHEMLQRLEERHPEILQRCEVFTGDKGYDDGKLIKKLWDRHQIKPVIGIRDQWKDGEETRLVENTQNVVYNAQGEVFCCCPKTETMHEMAFGGFEKDRGTLKYRCPSRHYGFECSGKDQCPVRGSVRIKLSENRRIFTPVARSSYVWQDQYNKRSAVERVNSRLDVSFGFERHFIRGLKKMKLCCSLALSVMLAMALGRIRQKQQDRMRSLVRAA